MSETTEQPTDADKALEAATIPMANGLTGFDPDSIIADYTPKSDTMNVILPQGEILVFKVFTSRKQKRDWEKAALTWNESLKKVTKDGRPSLQVRTLGEFVPQDIDEALNAHMIHTLALDPPFTMAQACKLLHAPELLAHIIGQLDKGNETMQARFQMFMIDVAKKKSVDQTSGEDNLEQAQEYGDDTPTS